MPAKSSLLGSREDLGVAIEPVHDGVEGLVGGRFIEDLVLLTFPGHILHIFGRDGVVPILGEIRRHDAVLGAVHDERRCGEEIRIDGVIIRDCRQLQDGTGAGLLRDERARSILVFDRLAGGDPIRERVRELDVLAPLRRLCADFGAVKRSALTAS